MLPPEFGERPSRKNRGTRNTLRASISRITPLVRTFLAVNPESQQVRRCRRALTLCVLVGGYGYSLSRVDDAQEVESSSWREIMGELHPDGPKSAERITESEVVPKWSEYLHADDVTKHLNWFQTFCMDKNGMDDHLGYSWTCNMFDVQLQWPTELSPMDPNMDCSASFVNEHIIQGDDPRCVPWGDHSLSDLSQLAEAQGLPEAANLSLIDPMYDEYTVRQGDPLWDNVHEHFEEVDQRLQSISHELEIQSQRKAQKLRTLSSTLRRVEEDDVCALLEEGCPSFVNERVPEVPCECFNYTRVSRKHEDVKNVCRNHHWGLMHLCQPTDIKVTFHIEHLKATAKKPAGKRRFHKRRLYFELVMKFTILRATTSGSSGWYSARIKLREGVTFGWKSFTDGICVVLTLGVMFCSLLRHLIEFVVLLPYRVRQILRLKDQNVVADAVKTLKDARLRSQDDDQSEALGIHDVFEQRWLLLFCGSGFRSKHMGLGGVIFENIAAVCFVIGAWRSYRRQSIKNWEYGYLRDKVGFWHGSIELLYANFFDELTFHGYAWLTLYCCMVFNLLSFLAGLRWLPMTMILAFVRSLYFMIAYGFLILGFAAIACILFGARFVQFSTLRRSCTELMLVSFSVPAHVFDDITPFQDAVSLRASIYLSFFLVLAVMIGLNFFTTILLDAYNLALDPPAAKKMMRDNSRQINAKIMQLLGIPDTLLAPEANTSRDALPAVSMAPVWEEPPPRGSGSGRKSLSSRARSSLRGSIDPLAFERKSVADALSSD